MAFVRTDIDFSKIKKGSHKVFTVSCDMGVSNKCKKNIRKQYKTIIRDRGKNKGADVCFYCSRKIKYSGRKNPNCKYKDIDDGMFYKIDSEEKAYFLGWVASDGHLSKSGSITICVQDSDVEILRDLKNIVCRDIPIKTRPGKGLCEIRISSKQMVYDICRHLGISPGKKSDIVKFPIEISYKDAFVRGYFDGDGSVCKFTKSHPTPRCNICSNSKHMLNNIKDFIGIKCSIYKDRIEFTGNNAIDFMGRIYNNASLFLPRKHDRYLDLCAWVPSLSGRSPRGSEMLFKWSKCRKDAIAPYKGRPSDSGYDLTVIDIRKKIGNVEMWDTGIKISPEYGWYFDLVPRSSIIKSGYILANSVGVIDRSYAGSILVPLIRVDNSVDADIAGTRVVQIIPRPIVHVDLEEAEILSDTDRGSNGFGSSGI